MSAGTVEIERLLVRLLGDASDYSAMLKGAVAETHRATSDINSATARIEGTFRSAVSQVQELIGVTGLLGTAFAGISMAAEIEKNTIAFGVMLQDMEKGAILVKDIAKFAAATPLEQSDIQRAAKTLLQFGVAGSDVMKTMKQLGDAAGGDAHRFNQMALAFGQVTASGRLMGQDLLQLINAGFNPLQELARTTGKTLGQLKLDMEKGAITTQMVRDAFTSATSEGGQFFGMMEKQSKSISGLFSTMKDDVSTAMAAIGQDLVEHLHLKDAMGAISTASQAITQMVKELPGPIKELTVALIALAAALVSVKLAMLGLAGLSKVLAGIAATAATIWGAVKVVGLFALGIVALPALLVALTGSLALVATAFGIFVAGAALVTGVVMNLVDWLTNLGGANEELAASLAHTEEVARQMGKRTDATMVEAAWIEDPAHKESFLKEAVAQANREVKGYEVRVGGAEEAVQKLNDSWSYFLNPVNWATGRQELKALKTQLGEEQILLEAAKESASKLNDELKKVEAAAAASRKVKEDAKKLEESLTFKIQTIGMEDWEKEIEKLRQAGIKAGADLRDLDPILANARGLGIMAEEAKKAADEKKRLIDVQTKGTELSLDVQDDIDRLRREAQGFKESADAARLLKLERDGLHESMVGHLEETLKEKQALEDLVRVLHGLEQADPLTKFNREMEKLERLKGTISEEDFSLDQFAAAAGKAADELKKALGIDPAPLEEYATAAERLEAALDADSISLEEFSRGIEKAGDKLRKSLGIQDTPEEEYGKMVERLEAALDSGAISFDEFSRGMDAANKKFDEAGKGAKGARQEIERFEAALAGSAEAAFRATAFTDKIASQMAESDRTHSGRAQAQAETPRFEATQAGSAEGKDRQDKMVELLREIRDDQREISRQDTMELEAAGLS